MEKEGRLVWGDKPSLWAALGAFLIGCFVVGVSVSLAIGSELPAPRRYIYIDAIFPPWHHPLNPASYIRLFFNLVPLVCFAITIWSLGGELRYAASRNYLERRIRWFGLEKVTALRDGKIELKVMSEDKESWITSLWRWQIEVRAGDKSLYLLGDSQTGGPYLTFAEPQRIVAKLSATTGWPVEQRVCHEQRPPPSTD